MALTHTTAIRNSLADLVVDAIDVGTTDASGDLIVQTAADATLCTINLNAPPAFGAAASGTATANGLPKEGTATGAGTAAKFRVRNRDNTEIFQGTVTATGGGGDMELSSTTIAINDVIRINTFTYTASA
jgi:hypothetical protein